MKFPGILMLFGGYVLVYSAVAARGRFAADPWASLFTDAYPKSPGSDAQGNPQPNPLIPVPVRPRGNSGSNPLLGPNPFSTP